MLGGKHGGLQLIYTVSVIKAGQNIYSHDIMLDASRSFAADVHEALDYFRKNFSEISLLDDDVELSIRKQA